MRPGGWIGGRSWFAARCEGSEGRSVWTEGRRSGRDQDEGPGPPNRGEFHLHLAEGCHFYIAATHRARINCFMESCRKTGKSLGERLEHIVNKLIWPPTVCQFFYQKGIEGVEP